MRSRQKAQLAAKLFHAVTLGDIQKVISLLTQGADIHYAHPHGQTPLHIAGNYSKSLKKNFCLLII